MSGLEPRCSSNRIRLRPTLAGHRGYVRVVRGRTIRFPDWLWDAIEDAATKEGVSVAHYIRDILLQHFVMETRKPPAKRGKRQKS